MKIKVLTEARALETGYHYTNAAAIVGILGSGVMKATNRKIGLEQSRIFNSSLSKPLKNFLKPIKDFSKEERELSKKYKEMIKRIDKARERMYDNPDEYDYLSNKIKDYKKEIKKIEKTLSGTDVKLLSKTISKYISSEDIDYFKSHIKNYDKVTLKDAIENNLIDKRIAFMIDVNKIDAEYWDRDIIRRELGQASEEENDKGVRSSGDNMYKSKSWSYTRSNIPVHSTKIKPELVRFTLDIEKISQRQPVDSFAWRKVSKNSNQTEVEERVVGDTPNIGKYIKSIDFPEEVFDTESKYLVYKGEDYPLYSFSMEKLKGEIQSIKDTGKFPYYDSIIKGIANGIYELKPVRDYFIRAIENDLSMGKAKGVGMELDIKNKDVKTFDSLIKFIENSTYTSYFKKPGGKNKKKIIHKLDIKVGTFKFSKDKSWEYSIPKKILEDINDLVIFYKTGKMPSKKPIAKDSPSNTEKDSKQNSLSQDELTIKSNTIDNNTIDNISLELASLGLSKLANHIGKIYIICIERNGKVAWSNFILSNNINGDLKNLSSKLKSNESIKVINCKNLSDKIKNPPLRNYERAISRKFYLPELTKYAHTQTGIILFNTLEEFVAFIHSQFHRVNDYGKLLKVGICTGTGGIDIIIKKNSISGKPTQEHC